MRHCKFINQKMKKTIIFSLFFIGSLSLKGQTTDLTYKIDSILGTQIMSETPGGAIGVVKDGKVLYKKMFGIANLDYRIPVTDSTVFNLASVSKQFTAFLVLLLEKEGKLNLDDTIQNYIPELKSYGHPITIRQLVHHTSGIATYDILKLFAGIPSKMPWDAEDQFNMIQSYNTLNFNPNEEFMYSNDGYFLLARIIEMVTGKTFSQCIKEKIFEPLDMKNAVINDSPGKIISNRASGYNKIGDIFSETNTESNSTCGYSNVYASVNDLINWSKNLTNKSLGGEQLFNRIFNATDTLNSGETISYTYGFYTLSPGGPKKVCHEGGTEGFRAYLSHFPETGFSVFVMANGETNNHVTLADKIADLCLNDHFKPEIKKEHKEITLNKEFYQPYIGEYLLSYADLLKFDIVNDTLQLTFSDGKIVNMYPEKENEFFLKEFDAQCTFVKGSSGKVDEIVWHQYSKNFRGLRYIKPKPLISRIYETKI